MSSNNNKKTGVSMGGTIEYTRSEKTKKFIQKKDIQKKKRAKNCINCEDNKEGYCNKHKNWCGKVNYICLGVSNPYENISKQNKSNKSNTPNKKIKIKDLTNKCKECFYSNGTGHCKKFSKNCKKALIVCKTKHFKSNLGEVIKPKFRTKETRH